MFSDLVGEHPKKMQRVQMIGVVLQNLPIRLFDLWQVSCGMMLDGQVQNLLDRGGPFLPSHSFNSPPPFYYTTTGPIPVGDFRISARISMPLATTSSLALWVPMPIRMACGAG